ncbi:MAG: glycosyltransferase family 2 protein [Proteobacteria bacterium]|nr:glycosyltransferase family 2 protein [Pseudomonadota bacterium]
MMLSIIIPAYNERNFIEEVVRRVMDAPYDKEIIIVDDGSTDGTREWLSSQLETPQDRTGEPAYRRIGEEEQRAGSREQRAGSEEKPITHHLGQKHSGAGPSPITHHVNEVKVIFHEKNMGKGGAVRTGVNVASGDIILVQDADLEYDPKDYPTLLEPILEGKADVVYGSRFLGGTHRVHYFWHYVGNMLITLISNMATDLNLTDMETGYKVFKREVFQGIEIKSNRFGFEPEITAKVARKGCVVYEVPISYYGRSYEEGKKITWKDGVKAVFTILKYKWFSR